MRKMAFIFNPISGTVHKQEIIAHVKAVMADRAECTASFYTTVGVGDAVVAARKFALEGYDDIIAIGGDGTVNEVAKGIIGSSARLGIIPVGSGNGLARHLGIPMGYQNALGVILEGRKMRIDAGKINDEYFFCTAGLGFDALVGEKFNSSNARGLASYMEHCAKEYVKYEPEEYEIEISGMKFSQKAFLITFANSTQWVNNAFIAPDANISDGMVDVVVWRKSPMVTMPLITAELFFKTINHSEFVDTYRCKEINIRRKKEGVVQYDGESVHMGKNICVSVLHDAIDVIVPQQTETISQIFDIMPQNIREMLPPQFWRDLFNQLKEFSHQQLMEKVPQQFKDIVPKLKKKKNEAEK